MMKLECMCVNTIVNDLKVENKLYPKKYVQNYALIM